MWLLFALNKKALGNRNNTVATNKIKSLILECLMDRMTKMK